jgi:hypothetical protein
MFSKETFLILLFFFSGLFSFSQSINGQTGLFFIPTAQMHSDKTLVLGAGYIPKGYFQRYERQVNPGMPTFVSVTFLPFVEIMFRYTHELNMAVNPQTKYYPDRMFAGRIRLVNESKRLPSLVIGATDFTKAIGLSTAPTNYSATYAVATKTFEYNSLTISPSLGYGFDVLDLDRYDILGFFGGVEFSHQKLATTSICVEYDSRYTHLGISHTFFDHLTIKAGLFDLKTVAGMIAYKYSIW